VNEDGAADALTVFGFKRVRPKRGTPRRGRVVDTDYLAWMAKQPPLVGYGPVTVHHVRRFGEPKDDRRTVPLPAAYHMIGYGSRTAIEALGKEKFQARFGIDLEAAIIRYNERYERERLGGYPEGHRF